MYLYKSADIDSYLPGSRTEPGPQFQPLRWLSDTIGNPASENSGQNKAMLG